MQISELCYVVQRQCSEEDHNFLSHFQTYRGGGDREQYTFLFVKRNASFVYY